MIDFKDDKEKALLLEFAATLNDQRSLKLIETGVQSASDAAHLAKLYWSIVDNTLDRDIEHLLEKIYTALHIHCGNRGFGDRWEDAIQE
ncbi:hypothetical protein QWY82_10960 [Simiduia curdlanivorans]|uniref:Uncharacterized protein n=1 Tax=Simiduia curdlanivorans TaxID=1492769 RepID=A0ABV8VA16_9GAMM|nr:hypothetical protein [Simiduia curdlanivorans]MDN3639323.1 hypothetical protein [Simiduia curdlanivorans]